MQVESNKTKRKVHPKTKATFLSHFFFCWELRLILKNYKNKFTQEDIYPNLAEHSSEELGNKLEKEWKKQECSGKRPSLSRSLFKMFGAKFMVYGVVLLVLEFAVTLLQPLCLKQFLEYYNSQQKNITKQQACLLAFAIISLNILRVLTFHHFNLEFSSLGMKVRVACSSLMYRKYLKLKRETCQKYTLGQMVNLLSNDLDRFQDVFLYLHHLWIGPLKLVIGIYYFNLILGNTVTIGFLIFFLFFILQVHLMRHVACYRLQIAEQTDRRIRLMNDIICGIQIIKMYTWEKPFSKLVDVCRTHEIGKIMTTNLLRQSNVSLTLYLDKVTVFFCVLTTVLTTLPLTPQFFFVLISTFRNINITVIKRLQIALIFYAEAKTSLKRIEDFLLCEHKESQYFDNKTVHNSLPKSHQAIRPPGFCLKHVEVTFEKSTVLNNASIKVFPGELVGIAGAAGSGKSTLLQVLLKEVEPTKGLVDVEGRLSYTAQEAWIFSASVRQNILFGQEMDMDKYQEVMRVCALEDDLSLFPHGDQTLVGERGVMLSGGQKARISLARAVYRDADIYLLDDPLSAVDAHVAEHIFNECILNYLKNKIVVLVTHQIKYLTKAKKMYFIKNGKLTAGKTHDTVNKLANDNKIQTIALKKFSQVSEVKESGDSESRSQNLYKKYYFAGHWLMILFILVMLTFVQFLNSGTDFFVAFSLDHTDNSSFDLKQILSTKTFLYLYATVTVLLVVSVHSLTYSYVKYYTSISQKLHNAMFNAVLAVPMKFFNDHSSGRILNRFSKDVGCVDQFIPMILFEVTTALFNVVGSCVTISILNYWLILPAAILILFLYGFAHLCKPTNKSVRRTEGIVRSPVFSHLATSIRGLTTIRALNAQKCLVQEFDHHQDVHSSVYYFLQATISAFTFWVDAISVLYTAIIVFSYLFFETQSTASIVGLAFTQSLGLIGKAQTGMKSWTKLNVHTMSVERILEYAELTPEEDDGQLVPPESWPPEGNIEFKSVTIRYSPEKPMVLNEICFNVKHGEKLGIVGRTGAGKTSLISALFRLFHFEGTILIDGIDTKSLSLQSLRSKISIIPQDPVLFIGSLRENLDPFGQYPDCQIWQALEEVQMKNLITKLSFGLETAVIEGGNNFSVGQKQLLCLVRAILRNDKIIILDEATANIDIKTDELIQLTIKKRFQESTVLTIAHRLNTVMDSDKILVMDAGRVAEFGEPQQLLQNPDGIFYSLVTRVSSN